ncbi:hypothetical protein JTE90_002047 [Oedothorax gibbosus]|uniref:Uncharacterized protein n=1 Tax=Oedothorax gibbosus TaxID=931172 RepID=A0AAV6UNG1_9ARAC|nr:hypothetical protein JTE90_002047 [Oedothorax gibbosus]
MNFLSFWSFQPQLSTTQLLCKESEAIIDSLLYKKDALNYEHHTEKNTTTTKRFCNLMESEDSSKLLWVLPSTTEQKL